jgi:hypothetical protein
MSIVLHFERSESCAQAHGTDPNERLSIPFDSADGSWVQLTYDSIRTQDGSIIAELDGEKCWVLVNPEGYRIDRNQVFSDVVIEFVDEKEVERKANFARLQAAGYNPHKLTAREYEEALEMLDEAADPSDEKCPECGAEIDRDDEGDWVHVIRDSNGIRIANTLDHQPREEA